MSLSYVNLILDLYDGAGNAVTQGAVTLTPTYQLADTTDHMTVAQAPIRVQLLGNPTPAVRILATDNTAPAPAGWAWMIAGTYPGAPPAQQYLVPFANGATQHLSDLLPSTSAPLAYTPVLVSGTPSAGQVITATSPTAADWQTLSGSLSLPLSVANGGTASTSASAAVAALGALPQPSGTPASGQVPVATGTGQASAWGTVTGSGGGIAPPAGDIGGTAGTPTVVSTHLSAALPVAQGGTGTTTGQAAKRVTTLTASSATYTPNSATTDIALITTPTAAFTVANPSGTPSDGQALMIRILSGSTAYTPSWGTAYSGSTAVPLPSSCTVSATDYLGFAWNAAAGKYHLLSYSPGF